MHAAWEALGVDSLKKLSLQLRPAKRLLAAQDLAAGELVLFPLTPLVFLSEKADAAPSGAVALPEHKRLNAQGETVSAYLMSKASLPKEASASDALTPKEVEKFIVPYWHVRATADKALGNMRARLMAATPGAAAFPVMVNDSPIAKGEEVLRYKGEAMDAAEAGAESKPKQRAKAAAKRTGTAGEEPAQKKAKRTSKK